MSGDALSLDRAPLRLAADPRDRSGGNPAPASGSGGSISPPGLRPAIVVALTTAAPLLFVPSPASLARTVTSAPNAIDGNARLPRLIAPMAASGLLLVALALSIFKPGWRVRPGADAAR